MARRGVDIFMEPPWPGPNVELLSWTGSPCSEKFDSVMVLFALISVIPPAPQEWVALLITAPLVMVNSSTSMVILLLLPVVKVVASIFPVSSRRFSARIEIGPVFPCPNEKLAT